MDKPGFGWIGGRGMNPGAEPIEEKERVLSVDHCNHARGVQVSLPPET